MTSPERQPLLHDLAVTLAAPTVVLSRPDGNLDAAAPGAAVHGLFHADVRAVSLLRVTLRPGRAPSGEHAGKTPPAADGAGGGEGGGWLPFAVMNATEG
ncbi:glycogen debranching N-terminal domain-containing protein, partial [Streptomyces mirabilis]|uniref:glycogen debranching N-terminal domain-containing protein n=1 Tax=Streptomyces mirabilis TaxID=68239 RepID=UPI00344473CB